MLKDLSASQGIVKHSSGWMVVKKVDILKDVVSLKEILTTVCAALNITVKLVQQHTRNESLSEARKIYCYFSRELTTEKLVAIASVISVHHTTVISNHRSVEDLLSVNDEQILHKLQKAAILLKKLQHEKVQSKA